MAGNCHAALENKLFEIEGRVLINFKMLRGDVASTTKEELCEQVHSGITQRITGLADTHSVFPEGDDFESIDLQRLS